MRRLFLGVLVFGVVALVVGAALAVLPPGGSFSDDDGNIHEPSIEAIAAEGITKGCNPPANTLYCPSSRVTRGQMAAFLTRALGLTERGDDPFVDDDDSVFEADIERMAAAGITKGCNPPTNDRFCPDADVSRGQMAAFLVRALGYTDAGAGDLFTDDDGSVFEADIDRLGTAGVTKGCNPPTNDRYCPDSPVLRDQMASFLTRALNLTPITLPPPTYSTTTTATTSTTLPATEHPQSGDGWFLIDCSNPTGTCTYSQATTSHAGIFMEYPPLPSEYYQSPQWAFSWYDPAGSEMFPSWCQTYYSSGTGQRIASECGVSIAGRPLGEYRGEACIKQKGSPKCQVTLLTVYFNVTK